VQKRPIAYPSASAASTALELIFELFGFLEPNHDPKPLKRPPKRPLPELDEPFWPVDWPQEDPKNPEDPERAPEALDALEELDDAPELEDPPDWKPDPLDDADFVLVYSI